MQESTDKTKQKLERPDWIQIFSEWEASDEKQKSFCEKRGINFSTFVYWRMQLKKKGKKAKDLNSFAAVKAMPTLITSAFKINFPSGISFTVPSTLDKPSLKLIFELLGVSVC